MVHPPKTQAAAMIQAPRPQELSTAVVTYFHRGVELCLGWDEVDDDCNENFDVSGIK